MSLDDPYYDGPYVVHSLTTGELDRQWEAMKARSAQDPRQYPTPTYQQAVTRAAYLNKTTGQTWGVGVPRTEG